MNEPILSRHLSAEVLQALLEGQLPQGEQAQAEEHLATCARCAAEMDGWRVLFHGLQELPELVPSASFADSVMAGLVPAPLPLAARVRGWLGLASGPAHPGGERLQDWVDGVLPAWQAARVRSHLEGCPRCSGEAAAWSSTFGQLGTLERLHPSAGFAQRVMTRVRVPAPVPQRVPQGRRALAWLGSLLPQTRRAWAAISGVALTPAVTLGLVLWTVLSNPALTPGALASFAWWKLSEFAGAAWSMAASTAMESAGLFQVYSFLGSLALSPAALAGAFVALSAGTVAAVWVLYRNLVVPPTGGRQVAHASVS